MFDNAPERGGNNRKIGSMPATYFLGQGKKTTASVESSDIPVTPDHDLFRLQKLLGPRKNVDN